MFVQTKIRGKRRLHNLNIFYCIQMICLIAILYAK